MGGGNYCVQGYPARPNGLSPRGRGKPRCCSALWYIRGSIPAWAGETAACIAAIAAFMVYPRVGGGNSRSNTGEKYVGGLSPRGRGKLLDVLFGCHRLRSIPAWAGETLTDGQPSAFKGVYPRVGGGNPAVKGIITTGNGLSPRGRGKPAYA